MGSMKVNIATLRGVQSQLSSVRRDLNDLLKRFDVVRRQLEDSWDGAFAQAYVRMLTEKRLAAIGTINQIDLLNGYVGSTIQKMEEYDRQWAARLLALAQEAARQAAEKVAKAAQAANKPLKDVVQTPARKTPSTNLGALANQGIPPLKR